MLSVAVLLLVAVTGVLSASQVPRCPLGVIHKVKAQWKKTGVPQDVMSFTDSFKIVAGSSSSTSQQGVCKTFKFTPGNLVDVTDQISLPCVEKRGVLTLPDSRSFVVSYGNGILVTVRCSKDGPKPTADDPPVMALAVSDKATKEDIEKNYDILTNLGVKVDYYKCD